MQPCLDNWKVHNIIPDHTNPVHQGPRTHGDYSSPVKPKDSLKYFRRLGNRIPSSISSLPDSIRPTTHHRKTVSETARSSHDLASNQETLIPYKLSPIAKLRHSTPNPERSRDDYINKSLSPGLEPQNVTRDDNGLIDERRNLADRLSAVLRNDTMNGRLFVPRSDLDRVITQASVEKELSRKAYLPARISHRARRSITRLRIEPSPEYGSVSQTLAIEEAQTETTTVHASFQQIFAILLLIDRPTRIWAFLREGVCDADLPLTISRKNGLVTNPKSQRDRKSLGTLSCLKNRSDISRFVDQQWTVLVPVFRKSSTRTILHHKSSDKQSLPFVDWKYSGRGGRFGDVYKAKIHPAHHEFGDDAVSRVRTCSKLCTS
jgi:hypothetical protein